MMKKILAAWITLILVASLCAHAEDYSDLDGMSLDQLIALQDEVSRRIDRLTKENGDGAANEDQSFREEVPLDGAHFPDDAFRAYIGQAIDLDGDDMLSMGEINACEMIVCADMGIGDLTGIEYFTSVKTLNCDNNRLRTLHVEGLPLLEVLYCGDNHLQELDVSNNPALQALFCGYNGLSALDVSHNTALEKLYCGNNNIRELSLDGLSNLRQLSIGDNEIRALNTSNCPQLESLDCQCSPIEALDLSNNFALKDLYLNGTALAALDLQSNVNLKSVACCNTGISVLDFSNNPELSEIDVEDSKVETLDVSHNLKLEKLCCSNCPDLRTLTLGENAWLEMLFCDFSSIGRLDISGCPELQAVVNENSPQGNERIVYGSDDINEGYGLVIDATTTLTCNGAVLYGSL